MKCRLMYITFMVTIFLFSMGEMWGKSGAVVLYNGAKYSMEASLSVFSIRKAYHRKIQILSDEGLKYASFRVPYYRYPEYTERVGNIKITVCDEDGSNLREIGKRYIQDVRYDFNVSEKQFSVPDVKSGDIIEIKYEITGMFPNYYEKRNDAPDNMEAFGFVTKNGTASEIIFPKWNFQEDIPVEKSEMEFTYFDEYIFDAIITGGDKVRSSRQDGGEYKIMSRMMAPRLHLTLSTGTDAEYKKSNINSHLSEFTDYFTRKNLKVLKLEASSLPAMNNTAEKYVINPQKYRASVKFDFKGKYLDTAGTYNYAKTWSDVNNILYNSRFFGKKIYFMQNFYKDFADSVMALPVSEYEKAKKICAHIRNDIKCTSKDGGMYIYNPRNTYKEKGGSNVEICAIAYRTLQKAGFNVHMALLKSRDVGHLYNGGISTEALNTAVLHIAFENGKTLVFDPTGNPHNMDLINPMYLVKDALLYGEGEKRVNLMNTVSNMEHHYAIIHVDPNGTVNGSCKSIFTNYSAYSMYGIQPDVNGTLIRLDGSGLDTTASRYRREYEFMSTSSFLIDDKLFISPFAEKFFRAEDFMQKREYPVEFPNPKTIQYTATLHIPDGYEPYMLPENNSWHQPRCGAKVTVLTKVQGNIVMFGCTIQLEDATIPLERYDEFQEWWQQMCSLLDEMIIFKKKGSKSFTETEQMTA